MDLVIILLTNGFFLSFLLLVLLIILASMNKPKDLKRKRIKEDLKKIKEQIEDNSYEEK